MSAESKILVKPLHRFMRQRILIRVTVAGEMEKTYSPPTEEDEKRKSPTMELRKVLIKNAREALLKYLTIERGKRRMMIGQGNMDCKVEISVAWLQKKNLTI